jgi:opacity protein-like surface antigen
MKKLLLAIVSLIAVSASAQKPPAKPVTAPVVKLNGRADSIQYTIGAFMALWMTNNGLSLTSTSHR